MFIPSSHQGLFSLDFHLGSSPYEVGTPHRSSQVHIGLTSLKSKSRYQSFKRLPAAFHSPVHEMPSVGRYSTHAWCVRILNENPIGFRSYCCRNRSDQRTMSAAFSAAFGELLSAERPGTPSSPPLPKPLLPCSSP